MRDLTQISEAELDVYVLLSAVGTAPLSVVADHAQVDEHEADRTLRRLVDLGVLEHAEGGRYAISSPGRAIPGLLGQVERDIDTSTRELARLKALLTAVAAQTEQDAERVATSGPAVLTCPVETLRLAQLLTQRARSTVRVSAGPVLRIPDLEALLEVCADAAGRGVAVRVLCPDSARSQQDAAPLLRRTAGAGVCVRTISTVPAQVLAVDDASILVARAVDVASETVVLEGVAASGPFVDVFERAWEEALPLELAVVASSALTPVEEEVVRFLENGVKDEVVAHRLGISLRTVRRLIAGLSTRAGAASRFQLGSRARQLGWIRAERSTGGHRPGRRL